MVFYQVVAQTLRQRLDEGFYGKKLPSIGALAAEFPRGYKLELAQLSAFVIS